MSINKRFTCLITLLFLILGNLKAQDYKVDFRKVSQLLSVSQERDRIASEALEDVKSRRLRMEEDLMDAQDNPKSVSKEDKKKLENDIKVLRKKEEELAAKQKETTILLMIVTDMLQASPKKRANFLEGYEKRFGVIRLDSNGQNSVVATTIAPSVETPKITKKNKTAEPVVSTEPIETKPDAVKTMTERLTEATSEPIAEPEPIKKKEKPIKAAKSSKPPISVRVPSNNVVVKPTPKEEEKKKKMDDKVVSVKPNSESSKTAVVYKKLDAKNDVLLSTPSMLDCNLVFDGMDSFTGKKKQETSPIILFAHTDDFMRATMKDKEYVTCEAAATRVEGSRVVYINLKITVQTKDAQRSFGFLDRGALFIFRFINGKKMNLSSNKTDIGIVDIDKGTTTYRAQLVIPETVEFTASELDQIRVSWSIGFEDYEIFDMDVMRNLFKCLDKK